MRLTASFLMATLSLLAQAERDVPGRAVRAFKEGRYGDATDEFQRAVRLDPSLPYDARTFYETALAAEPNDARAYYSLGLIAWLQWYPEYSNALAHAGLSPEKPGRISDATMRSALRAKWWPALDDAMQKLKRAVSIDPQYSEAMACMNLLIRERADVRDPHEQEQYRRDIAEANTWAEKALEAKRAQGESVGDLGPKPPAPPSVSGEPTRIKVWGNLSKVLSEPPPVYPESARQARIQGRVRLAVIIDRQGHVSWAQLISGHALLVEAAVVAVKQRIYQSAIVNGQPVELDAIVDVDFSLPN